VQKKYYRVRLLHSHCINKSLDITEMSSYDSCVDKGNFEPSHLNLEPKVASLSVHLFAETQLHNILTNIASSIDC
jgi:hypothetical protein